MRTNAYSAADHLLTGFPVSLPNSLTDQGERDALRAMVYELGDCLAAVATYLLVFDGPLDDIDMDELLIDIRLDAADALALWSAIGPLFATLIAPTVRY